MIPKMFRDRHRGPCAASADQRGLIRCCADHDSPFQAFRAEHVFKEVPQFPSAFAVQCDHHDVSRHIPGQMSQQAGLANAGAGKQTDPLAMNDG